MLDLIGNIAGMIAILINVVAIMTAITLTLRQRLIAVAIIGTWVGIATSVAAAGLLVVTTQNPVPVIGILFGFPSSFSGHAVPDGAKIPRRGARRSHIHAHRLEWPSSSWCDLSRSCCSRTIERTLPLLRGPGRHHDGFDGNPIGEARFPRRSCVHRQLERIWHARSRGSRRFRNYHRARTAPDSSRGCRFSGDAVVAILFDSNRACPVLFAHAYTHRDSTDRPP